MVVGNRYAFHIAPLILVATLITSSPVRAQSIILSEPTRVTLASSAEADGRVRLTASVTTEQGAGVPDGTIQFIDDATLVVLGWAEVASPSIVIGPLPPGQHRLRADYSGSATHLPVVMQPSRSALLLHKILTVPGVTLSSSDNPTGPGQMVTLTAAVTSQDVSPTGAVTLRDGSQVIAAHVALDRAGMASFTTSALADGSRAITAEYEGDRSHAPAVSARLVQDVGVIRIHNAQARER